MMAEVQVIKELHKVKLNRYLLESVIEKWRTYGILV